MSLVNGSTNNNPLAVWQSLFGQGASASGDAASGNVQSDPLSELLATIGQATGLATGSSSGSTSGSSNSTPTTAGSSSPQFDPQTLQALFDLQANAMQLSENGDAESPGDPSSTQGATSQTTANANGSTTTTITYADGSSVSTTTAAASDSSSATAAAGVSGGASGNNFLQRLIQMQAQLLNVNATQSIATA